MNKALVVHKAFAVLVVLEVLRYHVRTTYATWLIKAHIRHSYLLGWNNPEISQSSRLISVTPLLHVELASQ